jgi:hypothetical protein
MSGGEDTGVTRSEGETGLLVRWEGELVAQEWAVDRREMLIGRAEECDIRLDTRWVSRLHARVGRDDEGCWVEDAGSKNGVFVNGHRVTGRQRLHDGDRVQLAPGLELTFLDSASTFPLRGGGRPLLEIDRERREVLVNGQVLAPPLSTAQFDFLAAVREEPGRVYSRSELVAAVWPDAAAEGVSDDAIDALVRRLRQRLAEITPHHEYLVTIRGYGFRLDL